jgi:hypothetical protein
VRSQILIPEAPVTNEPARRTAADERQFEILRDAITLPPDPALVEVYADVNTRHFYGLLPAVPVVWEPRLVEVGALADDAFSLEGMFGHIGDRAIILLNPDLARNREAIRRALAHEMVHVWLYSIGEPSTGHGPAFQMALKRLAGEGAFSGLPATEREREALRDWLDSESSRLDSMSAQAGREGDSLEAEARDLAHELAALGGRRADPDSSSDPSIVSWRHRRDAHQRRVQELRDRSTRHQRDVAAFNAQVERYNLMAAYPHGLDGEPDR